MIEIERTLRKIVSNLWFEWNSDVHLLFRSITPYGWSLFRRNLYRLLRAQGENPLFYKRRLAELLIHSHFLNLIRKVEKDFKDYMQPLETFVSKHYPELAEATIAYFSMEYGIDILKTYSGGLGILSGDHLRGASDLGLRMVGLGLFYLQGYYRQEIAQDGGMKVVYEPLVPPRRPIRDFLPLEPLKKAGTQEEIFVAIPLSGREVKIRVWKAKVGRADLLFLDSNVPGNGVHDRHITFRLYASQKQYELERRRRIEQEIVLGIGGARALWEAGYDPLAYHLNEGHVAFAALEILRETMRRDGLGFDEARRAAGRSIGFTTHTPVPEGNECFDERLAREYLQPYLDSFLSPQDRETVFNCARNRHDFFDLTKLSLLLAEGCKNGVSRLHGEVCRRMWGYAWGNFDPEGKDVPITSITNAVHVPYWQKPLLRALIAEHGGAENARQVPDERLWALHLEFKAKLIEKVRERFAFLLVRQKADVQAIYERTHRLLDADSFMIGFARRFADYKRVTMLLDDEERLFRFLESSYAKYGKPIQIIYAGKPHPNNYAGRQKIQYIIQLSQRLDQRARERGFKAQVFFTQGYDIDLARYLEAGVDIWLNNPIRPLEASGTSGMKAGMNGVLNVSISDGWVPEGVEHGKNGWLFGRGDAHSADRDREELFQLLENEILPLYWERTGPANYSKRWLAMMKESIRTITAKFNTDRMMTEYIEKMYLPAVRSTREHQGARQKASA